MQEIIAKKKRLKLRLQFENCGCDAFSQAVFDFSSDLPEMLHPDVKSIMQQLVPARHLDSTGVPT